MNVNVALAALCTAGAVGSGAWTLIRPRRAPLRRIAPYTEVARSRLGVHKLLPALGQAIDAYHRSLKGAPAPQLDGLSGDQRLTAAEVVGRTPQS